MNLHLLQRAFHSVHPYLNTCSKLRINPSVWVLYSYKKSSLFFMLILFEERKNLESVFAITQSFLVDNITLTKRQNFPIVTYGVTYKNHIEFK